MVQGSENSRFLLKVLQPIGIGGKGRWKDFDCDASIEACVTSAIDLAHTARAERSLNLVGAELRTRGQNHPCAPFESPTQTWLP